MRVVFVNLHANEFLVKTSSKFLFKHSFSLKHRFFLDYLINNPDVEVCSFVNKDGFSLAHNLHPLLMFFLRKLRFIEHRFIIRKNGIPRKAVTLLKSEKDIRGNDIVISYLSVLHTLIEISDVKAFKAVSALHLQGEVSNSAKVEQAHPDVLFNESDLNAFSLIFQRYYSWYKKDFIVFPFAAAPRFQRIKPFKERENRAFSTGTINDKVHPEFIATYGNPCDQPSRQQILDNAKELEPLIACYNRNFFEDTLPKVYKSSDNKLKHYYKVWYNATHQAKQKQYFSFNMVEKFNDFKMCIVGEEILGVPGIGFVEGMSCGCAYIGDMRGYYESYGMKEGVHYIGYDGSLEDLKEKIFYYQMPEHQDELECIANAGYEFAKSHFNGEAVAKELLYKLQDAQKQSRY